MDYFQERRQALARRLAELDLPGFLVTNPVNVTYLTGFTGDSSYLAVTPTEVRLLSDARFEEQIQAECKKLDAVIRPHTQRLPEAAGALVQSLGLSACAVEADHLTLAGHAALAEAAGPGVTLVPQGGAVEALRAVKDMGEVEEIRRAVRIAERAFHMFRATLREQDTEKDMADALDGYIRRAGGRGSAFAPIVAVGERGALPHAPPTARTLAEGSKLLIDWGVDILYKSDLTRTVRSPFAGDAPTRRNKQERQGFAFEEVYAHVVAAHEAAVATLREGVAGSVPDQAARASLAKAKLAGRSDVNLADHFTHGLGHGLGLEVHEAPQVRANSKDTLTAGMVITIEPGVYLPGWGGVRVEDDYLITRDGAIRLSTLPRDPGAIG